MNKIHYNKNTINMKNIFYFLPLLILFLLVGCTSINNNINPIDFISSEISKIDNIENYSDETIKTIAIILNNSDQLNNLNNKPIINNDRIKNLINNYYSKRINKKIKLNLSNKEWSEKINKYEILEFLKTKNIQLANLNKLNISCEKDFAKKILFNSTEINFLDFAKYFKLQSNYKISLNNENNFIVISGIGNSFNFDYSIDDIEILSKTGLTFDKILDKIS